MPTITLTISKTNAEPPESEKATVELSDADVVLLRRYAANCERLEKAQLFETGLPAIQQITFDHKSGLSITVSDFKYGDLCGLLHLARPLLLSEEPSSFERTIALLGKRCESQLFRKHLKNLRSIYMTGDYGRYFQMTVNNVPLLTDEAARLWLNGVEYHQDQDKAEVVARIAKALSEETTRGIFASYLCGRVRALFALDAVVVKALEIIDNKPQEGLDAKAAC